jgi:hypothetical protein
VSGNGMPTDRDHIRLLKSSRLRPPPSMPPPDVNRR